MSKWRAGLALLVFSCAADGTKTGNGITMEFEAMSQALTLADAGAAQVSGDGGVELSSTLRTTDADGTVFNITAAHMAVTEIELRQDGGIDCASVVPQAGLDCDEDRLRLRADLDVDLVSGETSPALHLFEFPAGVYERIELTLSELDDDAEPLGESTFYVAGQFVYAGDVLDFELSLARTETLRFESAEGVLVEPGESLVAKLDVSNWFRTLPITPCLQDGELEVEDGRLDIADSGGCSQLENAFVDALRASTGLDQRADD